MRGRGGSERRIVGEVLSDTMLRTGQQPVHDCASPSWDIMDATTDMGERSSSTIRMTRETGGSSRTRRNGLPDGVDLYPEYLTRLLRDEPYNPGSGATPCSQSRGHTDRQCGQRGCRSFVSFLRVRRSMASSLTRPGASCPCLHQTPATRKGANLDDHRLLCPNHGVTTLFGITRDNSGTRRRRRWAHVLHEPGAGPDGSVALPSVRPTPMTTGWRTAGHVPIRGNNDGWNPARPPTREITTRMGYRHLDPSPDSGTTTRTAMAS
jgi:hypothetical protein